MKQQIEDVIKAQQEYIEFLGEAHDAAFSIAYIHGYRPPIEVIDKGDELREKLKDIQTILSKSEDKEDVEFVYVPVTPPIRSEYELVYRGEIIGRLKKLPANKLNKEDEASGH